MEPMVLLVKALLDGTPNVSVAGRVDPRMPPAYAVAALTRTRDDLSGVYSILSPIFYFFCILTWDMLTFK